MPNISVKPAEFYETQYNARAAIPDHPEIFARWAAQSETVRRQHRCELDLAYGTASAERLDFFPCEQPDAPLLVFIHGGWWRSLDKSDFSFIAPAFTQAGVHVAVTNYTLAPQASIEQITLQQVAALAWLYRHADSLAFNRQRIVLAGHSAGAHLAAMLMTTLWPKAAPNLPADLVKGGILLSGLYDLEPVQHAAFVNADLQLTPARIARLSPARLPLSHLTPFFTAVGALESSEFRRQNALIGKAWSHAHGGDVLLPTANHLTICDALADPSHRLCQMAQTLATNAA